MRGIVRRYVETVFTALPLSGDVYEFGALEVEAGMSNFRSFVTQAGLTYVGCDMRPGPGVDLIQDLHALDLPEASVGAVICVDTLEHVEYPRQAISEIHRILRPGGVLMLTSVMNFPIHAYPDDYWRFTPAGLQSLLSMFEFSCVNACGRADFPTTVVGVAVKGQCQAADDVREMLSHWQARENWRIEKIEAKYRENGLI